MKNKNTNKKYPSEVSQYCLGLHREKVVLGVVLSCYVVLGSRVVLCCVARSELR